MESNQAGNGLICIEAFLILGGLPICYRFFDDGTEEKINTQMLDY